MIFIALPSSYISGIKLVHCQSIIISEGALLHDEKNSEIVL